MSLYSLAQAGDPDALTKVEKGKSQFVGPEMRGKTLGVIGLGAIGAMVANAGRSLGMHGLRMSATSATKC